MILHRTYCLGIPAVCVSSSEIEYQFQVISSFVQVFLTWINSAFQALQNHMNILRKKHWPQRPTRSTLVSGPDFVLFD